MSLQEVTEVIIKYLKQCLSQDAEKISIKPETIDFDGAGRQGSYFLLSDIPGLEIQGIEFAFKIQFHGHLRGTPCPWDESREAKRDPTVIILNSTGAPLLSIKGSNQQQLLDNLRQKLIFIRPHPPGGQPAGGNILSIVQQLRELNDKVDMVLALLEAHH